MEQRAKTHQAAVRLSVPFQDLDPMQVVWHGNYFRYFERARQALFDAHGLNLYQFPSFEGYVFPVVRTEVRHLHPLRHRDVFQCSARLLEAHTRLKIEFEVRLLPDDTLCAWARSEQVALRAEDLALEFQIPAVVREAFFGRAAAEEDAQ